MDQNGTAPEHIQLSPQGTDDNHSLLRNSRSSTINSK